MLRQLSDLRLVGDSLSLPIKYLNGEDIVLHFEEHNGTYTISDGGRLCDILGANVEDFSRFVEDWEIEFSSIVLEGKTISVTDIEPRFLDGGVWYLVGALLIINDFASRNHHRKDYFLCH